MLGGFYLSLHHKQKHIHTMKTQSEILQKEFDFKAVHIGLMVNESDLWQHDKWAVIIEGETFEYSTGIGHRKEKNSYYKKDFNNLIRRNIKKDYQNLVNFNSQLEEVSTVKPLKIDDVLYSLLMDSMAIDGDFEDFCDNFGYDIDSRKALETYTECQKNTKKLKKFITDLEQARELFQDY